MNQAQRCFSLVASITTTALLAGCASTSVGTKLDPAKVALIKKGVTTRTEVECLLGPPTNVSIVGDGRRSMLYTFHETSAHAKGTSFIPYVNLVASGATGQSKTQTLQLMLTKQDVVEDYEFNDSASKLDTTTGILGTKASSTPVPEEKK